MASKKLYIALLLATAISSVSAQSALPVAEITKGVLKAAKSYQVAIACADVDIKPKDIAALTPYKSFDDRLDASYAVLWSGDVGCAGGSGTSSTNISIVRVGGGDSFYVDPAFSSPQIQFDLPVRYVERIVGNTKDSLILEGKEYGPNDSNCCPSINMRFTLRADDKGNWKLAEKKVIPNKR